MELPNSWTIVKFIVENSIEAVPTRWLIGSSTCSWPKYDPSRLTKAIKNCEPIGSKDIWDNFEVSIFRNATFDDYHRARKKCMAAEKTSDLDSQSDRKRMRKPTLQFTSGSDSSDESSEVIVKRKNRNNSVSRYSVKECPSFSIATEGSNNAQFLGSPRSATPNNSSTVVSEPYYDMQTQNHEQTEYETTPQNCNKRKTDTCKVDSAKDREYLKQILRKVNIIDMTLLDIKNELRDLKEKRLLENHTTNSSASEISNCWLSFNLPITNQNDLERFEDFLRDVQNMENSMTLLSHVGGESEEEFVRRALKKLVADEIQVQYSWLGKKQKKNFSSLNIAKLITVTTCKVIGNHSEKKIEDAFKTYLKRAPERIKK